MLPRQVAAAWGVTTGNDRKQQRDKAGLRRTNLDQTRGWGRGGEEGSTRAGTRRLPAQRRTAARVDRGRSILRCLIKTWRAWIPRLSTRYICSRKRQLAEAPSTAGLSAHLLVSHASPRRIICALFSRTTCHYAGGPASAHADAGSMDSTKTMARHGSREFHNGIIKLRETPALRYRLLLVFGLFLVWL